MVKKEVPVPMAFVYVGQVEIKNGKLASRLLLLNEDRSLGKERIFSIKRRMVIGGVYKGASFTETAGAGLEGAAYEGLYDATKAQRAEWEAHDADAKESLKLRKMEAENAKENAFDNLTIREVRELRHHALMRGDVSTASAVSRYAATRIGKFVTKEEERKVA